MQGAKSIVCSYSDVTTIAIGNFMIILVFFCQLHEYLSQNLDADVHFEVLNLPKFLLDQKLQQKNINWFPFFFHFGRKKSKNL